jgi:hypothetical protein
MGAANEVSKHEPKGAKRPEPKKSDRLMIGRCGSNPDIRPGYSPYRGGLFTTDGFYYDFY